MLIIYLALPILLSCATDRKSGDLFGPSEAGTLVVDAVLIVGQPLPEIFLYETAALDQPFQRKDIAIKDAQILVTSDDQSFNYRVDKDSTGRYLPTESPIITPNTFYSLEIDIPDGRQLRASTTTPDQIRVNKLLLLDENDLSTQRELLLFSGTASTPFDAPQNQINYRDGIIEAVVGPINVPAYQLAIFNLETDSELLLQADFLDEDDLAKIERSGASPPLSIRNGRARLPWFGVAYEGKHLFKIYAIEENWFDFIRTDPDGNRDSGGGLLGEQFQRPKFNIEGGIGIFASASVDSVGFTIKGTNY
tara:strand:+ start:784 stop:1704 length:921 start_codon:yes stop_codon:yes gene_type:complete